MPVISVLKYVQMAYIFRQYRQKTDNIMATGEVTKGQTVMYKSLHRKLKFEQCELYKDQGVNSGAPGGGEYEISVQLVTFLVFL
jgi:hypothetical protein